MATLTFDNDLRAAMENFKRSLGIESPKEKIERVLNGSTETPEEWIWVDGYKGTNADMTCQGYQYELGKQFDMPEGQDVVTCRNGFHLCLALNHVFNYYAIGAGHRFFRVKALVRDIDAKKYGEGYLFSVIDKLAAKSIIFYEELTIDEILRYENTEGWTEDDKRLAIQEGVQTVRSRMTVMELVKLGYSRAFAEYLVDEDKTRVAMAVGSQSDLSMDMKVLAIMEM